jgi:putative sterol carrier protein
MTMTAVAAFLSEEWAQQVRDAVNRGPDEEYRKTKIEKYWEWIDMVRGAFVGSLALGIREPDQGRYLRLDFSGGACTSASIVERDNAAQGTFVLEGDDETWRELLTGYDPGKAIMYRRLMLASGEILEFFNGIYFFVEVLASVVRVPTS